MAAEPAGRTGRQERVAAAAQLERQHDPRGAGPCRAGPDHFPGLAYLLAILAARVASTLSLPIYADST